MACLCVRVDEILNVGGMLTGLVEVNDSDFEYNSLVPEEYQPGGQT